MSVDQLKPMEEVMEIFEEEILEMSEEGLYTAEELAENEAFYAESMLEADSEMVDSFADDILDPTPPPGGPEVPSKFLTWLKSIKGTTWANMGFQAAMIGIMLYPLISRAVKGTQASGKRIKLSAAIDGAKATLVADYDKTIKAPAEKIKNNAVLWSKLLPEHRKEVIETIALTGEDFWALNGADIMKAYALMPIYDPTPA